jgi:hypothetical protein
MITSVKKLPENKFLLNDKVVIYNLVAGPEGITFDIDFNDEEITEKEATTLAETFIYDALENFLSEE